MLLATAATHGNVLAHLPSFSPALVVIFLLMVVSLVVGAIGGIRGNSSVAVMLLVVPLTVAALLVAPANAPRVAAAIQAQLGVHVAGSGKQLRGLLDFGTVLVPLIIDDQARSCQVAVLGHTGPDYDLLVACDDGPLPRTDGAPTASTPARAGTTSSAPTSSAPTSSAPTQAPAASAPTPGGAPATSNTAATLFTSQSKVFGGLIESGVTRLQSVECTPTGCTALVDGHVHQVVAYIAEDGQPVYGIK
jgi:hypothetical protein